MLVSFSLHGAENLGWHASGKGGAVVAENPKAVAAGIELLDKGGNAVDAAVGTMLVASIMSTNWLVNAGHTRSTAGRSTTCQRICTCDSPRHSAASIWPPWMDSMPARRISQV